MDNLKIEVDRFIVFLKSIERTFVGIPFDDCHSFKVEIIQHSEAEAVFKSMKSNVVIMLYNYVEATVRKTMSDFYNKFNTSTSSYSEVILELRKLWISSKVKDIKENTIVADVFEMIENSINQEFFISLDFEKDFSLSGNADVRTIKEILHKHGVRFEESQFSDYGGSLKSIKDMRNSLAHGNISFEDNGKDLTVADIEKYRDHVYSCINNFCELVNSQSF
jgi:hypothetical protein